METRDRVLRQVKAGFLGWMIPEGEFGGKPGEGVFVFRKN